MFFLGCLLVLSKRPTGEPGSIQRVAMLDALLVSWSSTSGITPHGYLDVHLAGMNLHSHKNAHPLKQYQYIGHSCYFHRFTLHSELTHYFSRTKGESCVCLIFGPRLALKYASWGANEDSYPTGFRVLLRSQASKNAFPSLQRLQVLAPVQGPNFLLLDCQHCWESCFL